MFFRCNQSPGFTRRLQDQINVQRLDRTHVHHAGGNIRFLQNRSGGHSLSGHQAGRDKGQVCPFSQCIPPTNPKLMVIVEQYRHLGTSQPHEDRPVVVGNAANGRSRLRPVSRTKNGHVGKGTHQSQIFDRLMRPAILADCNPAMGCDNLDVEAWISQRLTDLLKGPACGKNGKGRSKRDHAAGSQPGSHADHIPFGDSAIEKTLGKFFCKTGRLCGAGEIRIKDHNTGVIPSQLHQNLAVGISCCDICAHCNPFYSDVHRSHLRSFIARCDIILFLRNDPVAPKPLSVPHHWAEPHDNWLCARRWKRPFL